MTLWHLCSSIQAGIAASDAVTYYVDVLGNDAASGLSAGDAFATIQVRFGVASGTLALACADTERQSQHGVDTADNGDVVTVGAGTFSGTGNTNIDLRGKAIQLRGSGGNATRVPTSVIDCGGPPSHYGQLVRGFMFVSGEGQDTLVSGFEVANGMAALQGTAVGPHGVSNEEGSGGAVIIVNSSPTLVDMVYRDGWVTHSGGCVFVVGSSTPVLDRSTFIGCTAVQLGGGLYMHAAGGAVSNSIFQDCFALYGGGIDLAPHTTTVPTAIVNCSFAGCSATTSGGGLTVRAGRVTLGMRGVEDGVVRLSVQPISPAVAF